MNTVTNSVKIKSLFLLLLSLAAVFTAQAQTFGNEWINFSQSYYKIKVLATGMHRLDYNYLANAGLASANPQKLQLFRRGKEVAMFVNGETDGNLNPGDYLEFYGERNDGKMDKGLYKDPRDQVHPYYSLYSDTAAYFLTVSNNNGLRMQKENVSAAGLNPEPWHFSTRMNVVTEQYTNGRLFGPLNQPVVASKMSWADRAEGIFSQFFGDRRDFVVDSIFNVNTAGPLPQLDVVLIGTFDFQHDVKISLIQPDGNIKVLSVSILMEPYSHRKLTYPLQFSDIAANGTVKVRVEVNKKNSPPGPDLIRVAYLRVRYPRQNIFSDKNLIISPADSNKTSPSLFVFESPFSNVRVYDVSYVYIPKELQVKANGQNKSFVLTSTQNREPKVLITNSERFVVPLKAISLKFRNLNPAKASYVIISHKKLMKPISGFSNVIKSYAEYRASVAGGKHDTLVMEINKVYDQFFYGEKSPLAIRQMMKYLLDKGKPSYLLLIGTGKEHTNDGSGFTLRHNFTPYVEQDLVPTGGTPASDVFFTAEWQNDSYAPLVATGRLATANPADVAAYLDKVKTHESLPSNEMWRKNVLHLRGGYTDQEKRTFTQYLLSYKNKVEGFYLGAKVKTVLRTSLENVPEKLLIPKEINEGQSLITFFGHSSTSVSDLDIGRPSDPTTGYNNFGKYPMMLVNGCQTGNAFIPNTFGSDWIFTPRKGAILFLGETAFGYDNFLHLYSDNFYKIAFTDSLYYGKSVATIQQEVIRQTAQASKNSLNLAMVMQMLLQGDPAVALYSPSKPDYALKGTELSIKAFVNENLTAASDSFQIVIPLRNLGKVSQQTFKISVTRNDQAVVTSNPYPPVFNQDTLIFNFNITAGKVAGINRFKVFVDAENSVNELDETNNIAQFEYNFPAMGPRPLMPVEYAIVNTRAVKLIGQANNLLQANRLYSFELDTTHTFNSPVKQTQEINGTSLPTWSVNLLPNAAPKDSLVYYWRFRPKEMVTSEDTLWGESSFRYIPTSPEGWSQSQPGQFIHARTNMVNLNEPKRQWEFTPISKKLSLRTTGGNIQTDWSRYGIFVNGSNATTGSCIFNIPNILVAVFNNQTLEPYVMPGAFASSRCGELSQALYYFGDMRQENRREYLRQFLEAVPTGHFVAVLSLNQVPFADFSDGLKNAFRSVGSKLIDGLVSGAPFALVGQKGSAVGTAQEVTANTIDPTDPALQNIELNYDITGFGKKGDITSTLIGPASSWKTLYHTVRNNGTGSDRYELKVTGLDIEGKNAKLIIPKVTSRTLDLSAIDAKEFPFLQLSLIVVDSLDATAPQLKEWQVLYTGVPEGVVRADVVGVEKYTSFATQALKGKIDAQVAFQNISNHSFNDSLLARITLIGTNGFSKEVKLKALTKGETVTIPYTFATNNLSGNYTFRLTVNPLSQNPMLRPEQYYFNNTLEVPFALTNNLHPVLEVVFDGRHILDGDIVSPNPLISMTLQDEDKYTFLKDASHMEVYLKGPGSADFKTVNLSGNDIKYFAADKNNDFRLEYNPKNLPDGIYTLRVQGRDVAGNKSGFEPYMINFEVINESAVTHFYPYPNPFSSKTRFVFTLTGSTIPQ
ncbi:MAG: hypothetical protein JWQ14_3495, partial [Adhaeribacter sp.]|nr:hypothetical protein [Adhaeribacter sp.]